MLLVFSRERSHFDRGSRVQTMLLPLGPSTTNISKYLDTHLAPAPLRQLAEKFMMSNKNISQMVCLYLNINEGGSLFDTLLIYSRY